MYSLEVCLYIYVYPDEATHQSNFLSYIYATVLYFPLMFDIDLIVVSHLTYIGILENNEYQILNHATLDKRTKIKLKNGTLDER